MLLSQASLMSFLTLTRPTRFLRCPVQAEAQARSRLVNLTRALQTLIIVGIAIDLWATFNPASNLFRSLLAANSGISLVFCLGSLGALLVMGNLPRSRTETAVRTRLNRENNLVSAFEPSGPEGERERDRDRDRERDRPVAGQSRVSVWVVDHSHAQGPIQGHGHALAQAPGGQQRQTLQTQQGQTASSQSPSHRLSFSHKQQRIPHYAPGAAGGTGGAGSSPKSAQVNRVHRAAGDGTGPATATATTTAAAATAATGAGTGTASISRGIARVPASTRDAGTGAGAGSAATGARPSHAPATGGFQTESQRVLLPGELTMVAESVSMSGRASSKCEAAC